MVHVASSLAGYNGQNSIVTQEKQHERHKQTSESERHTAWSLGETGIKMAGRSHAALGDRRYVHHNWRDRRGCDRWQLRIELVG